MGIQAQDDHGRRFGSLASGAIREYRFVAHKSDGAGVIECTGDRDEIMVGVADRDYADGDHVSLQSGPVVKLDCDVALDKTDVTNLFLTSSADGQAAVWSPNAGKRLMAMWLPDGGATPAAGNPIKAILVPAQRPEPLTGTVTIALGAASGTAAVGTDYNAKMVFCSVDGTPDATGLQPSGVVAAGTLTVTVTTNATAEMTVNYMIVD